MDEKLEKAYTKLQAVRAREDLKIRIPTHLRETFTHADGTERPFNLRYYQVQGVLHLIVMSRFVLGDDTGLGKCVTGDTVLWTDRGLVPIRKLAPTPIEELTPGEFYELTQPTRVWTGSKWAEINRFYWDGERSTIKITTRSGYSVEGSFKHPLWVRRKSGEGWYRLPEIQEGDYLLVDRSEPEWPDDPPIDFEYALAPNANSYRLPDRMTPALARLMGYVVAEGHSTDKYRLTVTQHDPDAHRDIRRLFKEVFDWSGNFDNQSKDIAINVSSIQIRAFLERYCSVSKLSAAKRVPPVVMKSSRQSVVEFLRGFFEGEGHALESVGVEISSASERLLKDVHLLLLRLGIVSVLKPKTVQGYDHTYWRLTLFGRDARIFAQKVGFVTERKQAALWGVMEKKGNPNHDVVPWAKQAVEGLRAEIYARCGRHGYKGGGITKRWGSAFYNTLTHIRRGCRNPTYNFLEKMLEVAEEVGVSVDHPARVEVAHLCDRRAYYDPVVSIETGSAPVMDIEVDDPDHCFVGNGFVNHNTLQTITALCFLWDKNPDQKAMILTDKSAVLQWVAEFDKFTDGVTVIPYVGGPKKREELRDQYEASTGPTVLVMNYAKARIDISEIQGWGEYIVVFDECQAFKNPSSQTHQVCAYLASRSKRAWGLTATLIQNKLMEGYGIFNVIVPGLFGSKTSFMGSYGIVERIQIGRGRKVAKIVGYTDEHIEKFKEKIDPYHYGRVKFEVAPELPTLTIKTIDVSMSAVQERKYKEALEGLLEMGDGDMRETTKLTQIIYCQQIVNHPELIGFDGKSPKLQQLIDMVTEGEFAEQKVIVSTRFRKMVDIIERELGKKDVAVARVTGSENDKQRQENMVQFQDPNSDVNVICITDAGKQAINLQAAKAIIFYDTDFSGGVFLQKLGRMIRIGSEHDRCYAVHLRANRKRGKSIDHRTMDILAEKMELIEAVLGQRIKGEGDDFLSEKRKIRADQSAINDLFNYLTEDAREV